MRGGSSLRRCGTVAAARNQAFIEEFAVSPLAARAHLRSVRRPARARLIAAAALTYPAWLLVGTVSVEPVHRVMNRLAMLIALVGLVVLTRRLGLSTARRSATECRAASFSRQLGIGWVCRHRPDAAAGRAAAGARRAADQAGPRRRPAAADRCRDCSRASSSRSSKRRSSAACCSRRWHALRRARGRHRAERAVRRAALPRRQAARAARTKCRGSTASRC